MTWQDLINGLFEIGGSFAIWGNVLVLYRDKQVRGVHWASMVFFMTWGYWNLYYYPHLDQWLSFIGGLSIVTANTLWVGMWWHYYRRRGV